MLALPQGPGGVQDPADHVDGAQAPGVYVGGLITQLCCIGVDEGLVNGSELGSVDSIGAALSVWINLQGYLVFRDVDCCSDGLFSPIVLYAGAIGVDPVRRCAQALVAGERTSVAIILCGGACGCIGDVMRHLLKRVWDGGLIVTVPVGDWELLCGSTPRVLECADFEGIQPLLSASLIVHGHSKHVTGGDAQGGEHPVSSGLQVSICVPSWRQGSPS